MTKEEFFEGSDPNHLETQRLLEDSWNNRIEIDELNRGIFGKGIKTHKTFQEISNEIAMSTPFGKDSVFYRELREILTGQIPKL